MSAPRNHVHATEREPGPDEDCLWSSAVEWLHECYDLAIPSTPEEADKLRRASGDTGFSNITNLRVGCVNRYGLTLPRSVSGFANFWPKFTPGTIAVLSGELTNMSAHFRRFYPGFTGGHTVYAKRTGPGQDDIYWCDPGGPASYDGEPITKAQLKLFIGNYGYSQLLHLELPLDTGGEQEGDVPELNSYLPGYTAAIKRDASIRSAPSLTAPKLRGTVTREEWVITGWAKGEVYSGSDLWLVRWNNGVWEYTVKANVISGPNAPVSSGYTQAQLDAAIDAQKAVDAVACDMATAAAVQAEKDRVAAVLGV